MKTTTINMKDIAITSASKAEAIAFAEWIRERSRSLKGYNEAEMFLDGNKVTASELYDLFKKESTNGSS